jgi:hypothetical protein
VSRAIGTNELTILSNDKDNCIAIQDFLVETRKAVDPVMKAAVGINTMRRHTLAFLEAVGRLTFSKAKTTAFETAVKGKYEYAKLERLRSDWLNHVQRSSTALATLAEITRLPIIAASGGAAAAAAEDARTDEVVSVNVCACVEESGELPNSMYVGTCWGYGSSGIGGRADGLSRPIFLTFEIRNPA